jgi:hypothetical protein
MKERNGVRVGQHVRDLDGRSLGRVKELYDWGFGVEKGFPILFRKDHVFRYDEVRGTRDGALVVARTEKDLVALARGELPASWRIPAPADFPRAATPAEARGVFAEVASARLPPVERVDTAPAAGPAPAESLIWERPGEELGAGEQRRHAERRGQGAEARSSAH